ncbi:MAG: Calx-beta domain-containing protein [Sulfurovaceae bacterium]|nr:Calx-beta domain-containing protein [Sulfurovaceae bacterium]
MKMGLILRNIIIFVLFGTILSFGASFRIDNPSAVNEGNSGTQNLRFTIALYGPCTKNVVYTVKYKTINVTATAGSDYAYTSGTATIQPSRSRSSTSSSCGTYSVYVPIYGDTVFEPDETFTVKLEDVSSNAGISDNSGTGTIKNDDAVGVVSDFGIRYKTNLKGNMKVIGNTVLAPSGFTESSVSNSETDLRFVNVDSDPNTFNFSSAVLSDSAITSPTAAKVKWAGLYWSGYLHTFDGNDISNTTVRSNTQYRTLSSVADIDNVIQNHTIKFKIGSTSYDISNHTVLGEISFMTGSYNSYSYGCFADVTSIMQGSDPRGTYGVGNIPSMEGATDDGGTYDGLGNSGAWTLVVIYENTSAGEKTRNATVFDGFVKVESGNSKIINVSGFKTPKGGDVDSTLSIFASEGDRYITGDQFVFKNIDGDKANQEATLSSSSGNNNYFNSSITGVDNRVPNIINNNGIDIHTDQIGTNGYNIVSTNQTQARITLSSTGDVYYPIMVGFATELYMPKLCYDYSATIDGELMQMGSTIRTFMPHKNDGTLASKVFIRSLEGDFPYVKSMLKIKWTDVTSPTSLNPPMFSFADALVQNPHEYAYVEPEYVNQSDGLYYIGTDNSGSGGYRGTIAPYESLYAVSNFESEKLYGSTIQLDAEVTTSLALDQNDTASLTNYTYSTSDGTLEVCPGVLTYNPMWYQFNVENYNSSLGDYRLNTQVTGTDYNLQVVSYTKDASDEYTIRTSYKGAIEVEPFEIPSFQSLGSYDENKYSFDRICEDSSNGKSWSDGKRHFSYFDNTWRTPLDLTANDNKFAMRNSGVRLWVLIADYDGDGKLTDVALNNNCVNTSGSCFKSLYANDSFYKTVNNCDTACGSTSSDETCYQCLKTYYSQPICSRDNFSVRPYAIDLNASNVNNLNQQILMSKNDGSVKNINIISGDYNYTSSYHPISAPTSSVETEGYYFRLLAGAREIANSAISSIDEFFGLEFVTVGITSCKDSNHSKLTYKPDNINLSPWKIYNDNVGKYNLELLDRNWTMVDQARYKYKTTFPFNGYAKTNDCTPDSAELTGVSGSGCNVQSFDVGSYNKIPVRLLPYKIDISSLAMTATPNTLNTWVYMNDLARDITMAIKVEGIIRPLTRDNKVTSNFTQGCYATDVNLSMDYNSTDFNASKTTDIAVENLQNHNMGTVGLRYTIASNNDGNYTNADINNTKRITISKDLFKYDNNGTMPIDIRFNITKIWDKVTNPVTILFKKLTSVADTFKAWFNGAENSYTPNDKRDYNENKTFIYGRVYTPLETDGAKVTGDSKNFVLYAIAYVSSAVKAQSLPNIFDANGDAVITPFEGLWYLVEDHSATDIDGKVIGLVDLNGSATVTPNSNILFDNLSPNKSGVTGNINVSYPKGGGRIRPYIALVEINPDIWLKYHPTKVNGNPEFSIRFEDLGYNWAGQGNTGNIIKQTITPNSKNKVNW